MAGLHCDVVGPRNLKSSDPVTVVPVAVAGSGEVCHDDEESLVVLDEVLQAGETGLDASERGCWMFRFDQVDLAAGGHMITMKGIVILEPNANLVFSDSIYSMYEILTGILMDSMGYPIILEIPHRETDNNPKTLSCLTPHTSDELLLLILMISHVQSFVRES